MTLSSPLKGTSSDGVRRFGVFELDLRAGELRREGVPVKLQPQPFRVLALLVERAGDLVTREELKKALWGEETYVDFERGLNFCINQVRAALGDSADAPTFVQTLPRRGYRFIAAVQSPFRVGSESTLNGGVGAVAAGVALLATLIAGASFVARRATPTTTAPDAGRRMIAVLPLEDLTAGDPLAWFSDGLTEELIAQMGRVSPARLGVIARTSAMAYRNSGKTIAEIGRELRVSHVLEGSLRRDGERLRITMQLVDVDDQTPVWSETFDRTLHASLTVQNEIAAQVTRALTLELIPSAFASPRPAAAARPDALDAYLRGRYFANRAQAGDLRTALEHLEEAARLDPSLARAHAAIADAHHMMAMFGLMPPAEAYAKAADAARTALRLDPHLADAHAAAGVVALWSEWRPAAAAAAFERALSLNPSDAAAHHDLAFALVALQRFDEAVAHIVRARDLDPVSPRASNDIGWLYLQIRQPSEAIRACRQTLAIDPDSVEAQQCLERAHLQRGELHEAMAAARAAAARTQAPLPAALDGGGDPAENLRALWRHRLDRLLAMSGQRYVSPYTIAMHHAVLHEDDQALTQLERALDANAASLVLLPTDPVFDRLRAEPRFLRLVEAIRKRQS